MTKVRIDIKGQMTDLPPENIPQGASQEMVNMRYVDGAWRPVSTKKVEWEFPFVPKSFYIHQVEGLRINIVYYGTSVFHFRLNPTTSEPEYNIIHTVGSNRDIKFTSFNEVLLIYDLTYVKTYVTRLSIDGSSYSYSTPVYWNITLPKIDFYSTFVKNYRRFFTILEDRQEVCRANYLAVLDEARNNNHFCSRVFVRYALKMFDGTYICYSAIIPVYHNIESAPYIENYGKDINHSAFYGADDSTLINNPFDQSDTVSSKHSITLKTSVLRFEIPDTSDNNDLIDLLKTSKDLIVSLDIFVSAPNEIWDIENIPENISEEGSSPNFTNNEFSLTVPNNSKDFETLNAFYLLTSIPIDNVLAGSTDVDLGVISFNEQYISDTLEAFAIRTIYQKDGVNSLDGLYNVDISSKYKYSNKTSITGRKVLPIQDNPHTVIGNSILNYNNRIFFGDVIERLFSGSPSMNLCSDSSNSTASGSYSVSIFYYIETESGELIVQPDSTYNYYDTDNWFYLLPFITYPDSRCKKIGVYITYGLTIRGKEFTTKIHPYLNLAYAYTGISESTHYNTWLEVNPFSTWPTATIPTITSKNYRDRNRVMISKVNNPFVFPAEDINNVGSNDIVGIITNSKQMSEGQFGLHPIIILTIGGVWAIEIGTGAIFTKNIIPLSKDECTGESLSFYSKTVNADVILYLSRTGVKMLEGTNVIDITQYVKRNKPSVLDSLIDYTKIDPLPDPSTLNVGEYTELTSKTAEYAMFDRGDWVLRISLEGTISEQFIKLDKSYYFYTNFDNYLAPKSDETDGWDNTVDYELSQG